jgi:hypothetical protein
MHYNENNHWMYKDRTCIFNCWERIQLRVCNCNSLSFYNTCSFIFDREKNKTKFGVIYLKLELFQLEINFEGTFHDGPKNG